MGKSQLRMTKGRAEATARAQGWGISITAVLCLALVVFVGITYRYSLISGSSVLMRGLSAFVICVALAITLERILLLAPLGQKWRYRIAFLGAWGVILVLGLVSGATQSFRGNVLHLLASFSGAFVGGVLVSGIHDRFWEDNFPPQAKLQAEVEQIHHALLGRSQPSPFPKRAFDILLALVGLLFSSPIWLLSAFLIWFEDPGPILFIKNSVGLGGRNFRQLKFRTMVSGAEIHTGPILAQMHDERVLVVGRFLRKTALDELPQLLNVLRGDMSLVGPRPQRTVLVRDYLERMPEYALRHSVSPGLAGLAQVAGDYYLTPRQKLRFDRVYIQNYSLAFDLKLIFLACLITFWFRWRKDWKGKLPRGILRFGVRGRH